MTNDWHAFQSRIFVLLTWYFEFEELVRYLLNFPNEIAVHLQLLEHLGEFFLQQLKILESFYEKASLLINTVMIFHKQYLYKPAICPISMVCLGQIMTKDSFQFKNQFWSPPH